MVHWPSSWGAFCGLAAVLPASGVGFESPWPICSAVNISFTGTGSGTVCASALADINTKVSAASEVFIDWSPSAGTTRQHDEGDAGNQGGNRKATAEDHTP